MSMGRVCAIGVLALVAGGAMATEGGDWRERAELPRPVAGYMGGAVGGRLLVAGGSYWDDGKKHWTAGVQVFDPRANRWTDGEPMPEALSDAACAVVSDELYVFGGGADGVVRKDALVHSGGHWRWLPEAELPEPRLYAAAVSVDNAIYLLGGLARSGDYQHMSTALWRWSRDSGRGWDELPALPGPGRINHAMTVLQGKIYVFGGAAAGPQDVRNLSDAYMFDPATERWSKLPALPIANRAWWAVAVGDRALLIGGYTDDFVADVYAYAPGQGLERVSALPHPLADAKFFHIGDSIVGAGGEVGPGVRGRWTLEAAVTTLASK
ncbi:MAG: hypothetical protein GEU99_03905 [Luteitalea sp.]|nr:hypothetical protein [Luteitalea sp.]